MRRLLALTPRRKHRRRHRLWETSRGGPLGNFGHSGQGSARAQEVQHLASVGVRQLNHGPNRGRPPLAGGGRVARAPAVRGEERADGLPCRAGRPRLPRDAPRREHERVARGLAPRAHPACAVGPGSDRRVPWLVAPARRAGPEPALTDHQPERRRDGLDPRICRAYLLEPACPVGKRHGGIGHTRPGSGAVSASKVFMPYSLCGPAHTRGPAERRPPRLLAGASGT